MNLRPLLLACALAAVLPARAQPPQAPPANTATPAGPVGSPILATPSRLLGPDTSDYLTSLNQRFSIRSRNFDPFGQPQNPDHKPRFVPSRKNNGKKTSADPKPLHSILSMINITAVMPREKCFLIDGRVVRQGSIVTLRQQTTLVRARVDEVGSSRIVMTDVKSGETAVRELSLLPDGMNRDNTTPAPRGMSGDSQNAPIDVESPFRP
jgi:hypothetical protein